MRRYVVMLNMDIAADDEAALRNVANPTPEAVAQVGWEAIVRCVTDGDYIPELGVLMDDGRAYLVDVEKDGSAYPFTTMRTDDWTMSFRPNSVVVEGLVERPASGELGPQSI